ncbi:MAG: membrane protein insertase YidC [Acidobacteriia bacterium]|nr:membrane protein insertase YidC [Terriglobia bacterium]
MLIALVLIFGWLILGSAYLVKKYPTAPAKKPASAPAQTAPTAPAQAAAPAPAAAKAPAKKSATAKPAPPPAVALPIITGSSAQDMVVENDLYRVTFSTQGALVKSWVLKKFKDEKDQPLDLVDAAASEKLGYPMSLGLADADLQGKLNQALYVATPSGSSLTPPVKLEFTYSDGKVQARKQFTFGTDYVLRGEVSVYDGQRFLPVEVGWYGGFGDHTLPPLQVTATESAVFQPEGADKPKPETLMPSFFGRLLSRESGPPPDKMDIPGPLALAGLEDRYFAGIILPGASDEAFRFGRRVWTPPDFKGKEEEKPRPLFATLGSAQAKPLSFRMFVGPKDLDLLKAVNPPLDGLVDFGWFTIFAKPLFMGLRYIHDHWVNNYGWAIAILTIIINMLMFPLKLKQIRSAQEMQRIQPLMKGIQDKYKQYKLNDPRRQKMNQEMMKLYSEHHINPLGGCLPMVVQLPILYGFYRVLELPIELRHAPWIWWIKDLSAPDTFHPFGIPVPILPTIMVISMFLLQKMTPMAVADPNQRRMMYLMPIVFGIMFYKLASGLVLYFLIANLVGITQQLYINKRMPLKQAALPVRKTVEAKE